MSSSALAAGVRKVRETIALQRRNDESDEQLLCAFTDRHDDLAFAALVRRHGPMVLGVCRRVLGHQQDAEDAFQATFLALAHGATKLRNKAALASYLHGTAQRIALGAKRSAARRRKHEGQALIRLADSPGKDLLWREVQAMLDEEIARLPEIYRSVFVLCCLENTSRAEAARRLGLKEVTVVSRLAGARRRLQHRLSRRGVELTALLAVTALATPPTSALPIEPLLRVTKAAVSPAVAALAEGATPVLSLGKAKLAAVLLAVSMLTGVGLWASRDLKAFAAAPLEPPATQTDQPKTSPAPRQTARDVEIHGRVLGPDGQPKPGARLLLGEGQKPQELGTTAADGRFTVALPKEATSGHLIAQAEGTGIDFLDISKSDLKNPLELRLVNDREVRGRVVNTEGKPVAGVRVTVRNLGVYAGDSMDSFLVAWKKRHFMSGIPGGVRHLWSGTDKLFAAVTDADGRFALRGLGDERLVALNLRGAGIAEEELWVVNRGGFDPRPYNQATLDNIPKGQDRLSVRWLLYGPDLAVSAEVEKILRGVVKDADTGKGRPGVQVRLTRREGGDLLQVNPQARTNAQGHYELHGARKAKRYLLEVAADTTDGYLPSQVWADDTAGYPPITADIAVKKGVLVTGKMIDGATGKPVPGYAMIGILSNNPFVKDYPDFDAGWFTMHKTDADGAFRAVAIPGHVLLMGGPPDLKTRSLYKPPAPDPKYPQYFLSRIPHFPEYLAASGASVPLQNSYCKVLDIKADARHVEQDIVLERASILAVPIHDADGKPLPGVWVAGTRPEDWYSPIECKQAECSVYHLEPGQPRLLVFYHPARKLAGTLTLKGDEKVPPAIRLGPMGTIKGRLLDADGKPLAGLVVDVRYRPRVLTEMHRVIYKARQIETDADGVFTVDALVPQQRIELSFHQGKRKFERESKPAGAEIEVKPGEVREVGAIKLKQPHPSDPEA